MQTFFEFHHVFASGLLMIPEDMMIDGFFKIAIMQCETAY